MRRKKVVKMTLQEITLKSGESAIAIFGDLEELRV